MSKALFKNELAIFNGTHIDGELAEKYTWNVPEDWWWIINLFTVIAFNVACYLHMKNLIRKFYLYMICVLIFIAVSAHMFIIKQKPYEQWEKNYLLVAFFAGSVTMIITVIFMEIFKIYEIIRMVEGPYVNRDGELTLRIVDVIRF